MTETPHIPQVGLGTWELRGEECYRAVRLALDIGFLHIDTARRYENEAEIGRALSASPIPREDLWLTTKIWHTELGPKDLTREAEASLRDLGTDYVDLLLVHWPSDVIPLRRTLDAMASLQQRDLVRRLGVSNMSAPLFREAVQHAPIACHQFECHPYLDQRRMLALADEYDVTVTAAVPLAKGKVLDDPVVMAIAEEDGVKPAQVVLAWLIGQGLVVIPRSRSHDHLMDNLLSQSIRLSDDAATRLAGLARGLRLTNPAWAPDWNAP